MCPFTMGFPGGSENKEFTCNAGNLGSVSGLRRFPGEGNSYLLQYFGLENSTDRGAWWATIHGLAKSQTQLSDFTFTFITDYSYKEKKFGDTHPYT